MIGVAQFPRLAMNNRPAVERSAAAGCFHCCRLFEVAEIKNYTDNGRTCLCPHCGVDSVVGCPGIDEETLRRAHRFWYKKN